MDSEIHEQLLSELRRPHIVWRRGARHGSAGSEPIDWIPISNIHQASIQLGLSSDGRWVRVTPRSVIEMRDEEPAVFMLPVLEVTLGEFQRLIEEGLKYQGMGGQLFGTFPVQEVTITGLESHSEHWEDLALKWAPHLTLTPRLRVALEKLARQGATQQLRHAARKMVAGSKSA